MYRVANNERDGMRHYPFLWAGGFLSRTLGAGTPYPCAGAGLTPLPVRMALQGVGHLYRLCRRTWSLGLTDGLLPVRVGVLEEDHVAVLCAGGATYVPRCAPEWWPSRRALV